MQRKKLLDTLPPLRSALDHAERTRERFNGYGREALAALPALALGAEGGVPAAIAKPGEQVGGWERCSVGGWLGVMCAGFPGELANRHDTALAHHKPAILATCHLTHQRAHCPCTGPRLAGCAALPEPAAHAWGPRPHPAGHTHAPASWCVQLGAVGCVCAVVCTAQRAWQHACCWWGALRMHIRFFRLPAAFNTARI